MKIFAVIFLLATLSAVYATWVDSVNFSSGPDSYLTTYSFPLNITGVVTISVTQNGTANSNPYLLCFQQIPAITNSKTLAQSCLPGGFASVTATASNLVRKRATLERRGTTSTIQIAPGQTYSLTVIPPAQNIGFSVGLTAEECATVPGLPGSPGCQQIYKNSVITEAQQVISFASIQGSSGEYVQLPASTLETLQHANTTAYVSFNISSVNPSCPFTLYALQNAFPPLPVYDPIVQSVKFDAQANNGQTSYSFTLYNPYTPNVDWYFLVYNTAGSPQTCVAFNVTVIVNIQVCNQAGNLDFNCQAPVLNYTNLASAVGTNIVAQDAVNDALKNSWRYFFLNTTGFTSTLSTTFVRVSAASTSTSNGAPLLFARQGGLVPTFSSFDVAANTNLTNGPNQIIVTYDAQMAENWIVGVYGNIQYNIWFGANCANNCSDPSSNTCTCNGGTCDFENTYSYPYNTTDSYGICHCSNTNDSPNYYCAAAPKQSFETIYIVLIAVGGAIILAVAIGVPVYCYLQNRKRARYERV